MKKKKFFYDNKSENKTSTSKILSQYKKGVSSKFKDKQMKKIFKNIYRDPNNNR